MCHRYAVQLDFRGVGRAIPWVGTHGYHYASATRFRACHAGAMWGRERSGERKRNPCYDSPSIRHFRYSAKLENWYSSFPAYERISGSLPSSSSSGQETIVGSRLRAFCGMSRQAGMAKAAAAFVPHSATALQMGAAASVWLIWRFCFDQTLRKSCRLWSHWAVASMRAKVRAEGIQS